MKVFAYKSRKDFLKIHWLAKVHGDRNVQTLPVGMDAGLFGKTYVSKP